MQQATSLPFTSPASPSGPCLPLCPPPAGLQERAGCPRPQPRSTPSASEECLLPASRRVPRLRAVVESQAFRNILVDEMDLMLSRAATLIQANWRGYRLRQKLVSQMSVAKSIQEAWRRFSTRRLLRSSKAVAKRASREDGDIPYHPPQQVRFQSAEACGPCPLVMVNKETQFPSSDSLVPRGPQPPPEPGFLPHRTVATRVPCPVTQAVRGPCLVRHTEADVKSKHMATRATRVGITERSPSGRWGHTLPGSVKTQAHAYPVSTLAKTPPPKPCPGLPITKTPVCPASTLKSQPPPCPTPVVTIVKICPVSTATRPPPVQVPLASVTCVTPAGRPAVPVTKVPPQVCLLTSVIKSTPPTWPVAAVTKMPLQTCAESTVVKTSPPQVHLVQVRPLQTCPPAVSCKTSSQTASVASSVKPPPQTRLAAMITKTPAQIRSVAAVLKTLCSVPPAVANFRSPLQTVVTTGVTNTSSQMHLSGPKGKVVVKQATGTVRVSSQSYLAEGKGKCVPQTRLDVGTSTDTEKIKTCSPKTVKQDTTSKTSVAVTTTRVASWTKVAEDQNKRPVQVQQRAEVIKVQSRLYVPMDMPVTLPKAQLAVPLTKALSHLPPATQQTPLHPQLVTCPPPPALSQPQPAKTSSHARPPMEMTVTPVATCPAALPQPQVATHLTKPSSHSCPPAEKPKASPLAHLVSCLSKVHSQSRMASGLTKAQSQAQLATETTQCPFAAAQSLDPGGKTQSQPLLTTSKVSTLSYQHLGAMARAKPENRGAQLQAHVHGQGKATQGPCRASPEPPSVLVPLLTFAGHPVCNVESWGDTGPARPPPPPPSQATSCPEDIAASQVASLCADLASVLGSPEDVRAMLTKALSQGEVRAALSQALSREVLGTTMAKALPHSSLGVALMKALSWGELGVTLSRVLSRGELRTEVARAMQGKLAEVVCKALTEDERVALSQALCQGELGAVLTQSMSQAARRPGPVPGQATLKPAGSRMTALPAPLDADCRGGPSLAWGPVSPQPRKVRVPRMAAAYVGWPAGHPQAMGDGAASEWPPCSPLSPVGAFLVGRMFPNSHRGPLITGRGPVASWEVAPTGLFYLDLHLNPEVRRFKVCLTLRVSGLQTDTLAGGEGPLLPRSPHFQPPHSPGQPLTTNGAGPSSNQSPGSCGTSPGSQQTHVASRVTARSWASSGEGGVASRRVSGGKAVHSQQVTSTHLVASHWSHHSGVSREPARVRRPPVARVPSQVSKATEDNLRRTQPRNGKQSSLGSREGVMRKVTQVSPEATVALAGRVGVSPSVPRQERGPAKGSVPVLSNPRMPVTRRPTSLLDELVTTLPQHPRDVLAKSFSWSPRASGQAKSESHSSGGSDSSRSISTLSENGLQVVELTEEPQPDPFPSGDTLRRPQGWTGARKVDTADRRQTIPPSQPQPSTAMELKPLPGHNSTASSVATSVQWGSDSSARLDSSSMEPPGGLSPKLGRAGMRTSLSLGTVVPRGQWPEVTTRQELTLAQPPVARTGAPHPGLSPGVNRVSAPLSQPVMATRVTPGLSQPPQDSRWLSELVCPSKASVVSPGHIGLSPNLASPSVVSGMSPSLAWPSVVSGVSPGLASPSVVSGVSPGLASPSVVSGVSPGLASPSVVSGVSPSLAPPSVVSGVSPSLAPPSVVSGVSPSLASPSVVSGVSPSLAPSSVVSGVSPSLAPPSVVSVVSPSLALPSVVSGVSSLSAQPLIDMGMSLTFTQPRFFSGVTARPGHPFLATGVDSSLSQAPVAGLQSLSRAQLPVTCGVSQGLREPAMVPGVDSCPRGSRASVQAPCQGHPSVLISISSGRLDPCVAGNGGQPLPPPPLDITLGPSDGPLLVTARVSSLRDPERKHESLGLHQVSCVHGSYPSVVTVATPDLCQAAVDKDRGSGLSQHHCCFKGPGTSPVQGPAVTTVYPSIYQGPVPAGWAEDTSQGHTATPWPGSSGVVPLIQETASVSLATGQRSCPSSLPGGLQRRQPKLLSPVSIPLPRASGVSMRLPSSFHPVSMATQAPVMLMTGGDVLPGARHSRVATGTSPHTVLSSVALRVTRGCVVRGVGQRCPPGPRMPGVAPSLIVDAVAQTLLPGSTGVSPGALTSRVASSHTSESVSVGDRPPVSIGPLSSFAAPGLTPGSVATVLSTALTFGRDPGVTMVGALDDQATLRAGQTGKCPSQVSITHLEPVRSEVLEVTPWTHWEPLVTSVTVDRRPLDPVLKVASVPVADWTSALIPQSRAPHESTSNLIAATGAPVMSVEDKGTSRPLVPEATADLRRSPGTVASDVVSESPGLAGGGVTATGDLSHAQPAVSSPPNAASTPSQVDADPSVSQKPAPLSPQSSLHPMAADHHQPPLTPTVSQGPVDAGGQSWPSAVPGAAARPVDRAVAPRAEWTPARDPEPWDGVTVAAAQPRQPGQLVVSLQTAESLVIVQAVTIIQACVRGHLVRRTIKVWHQWATVIQATWRGHCVRRDLARLYRATTVIQATWRGHLVRQACARARQALLPPKAATPGKSHAASATRCPRGGHEVQLGSEHRCFLSCQPDVCAVCRSLSSELQGPPSVVMLMGCSLRTCHTCGHSLPTRVVQGTGQGSSAAWARVPPGLRQPNQAATAIQSAWRGFKTRRQLRQQQLAARTVQATWRGHYTRSCLTTDALLGHAAPHHASRPSRWPGV
ncbi:uncharacterized protein [Castor canadensis]|uniref:Uncharacterized protein n=1 Tax=Castor canadensis TaxID=51338 RepID=A0AC58KXP0_CASCN